ncbi:MAG: tetratricopeptide repeat protein [Proteobacteria bacterium]|nr:tetratricopeptide repeat protein [Pseudomonadota bacterium]
MRSITRIVVLALALGLSACASFSTGKPAPAGPMVEDSEYGNYLAARFAASEYNLHDAAIYYRAALKADPDDEQLLALAFFYSTSAGDIDDAAALAQRIVAKSPDDRAARLALAVAAMKKHDYAGARKQIALSARGPFASLTISLFDAWAAAGMGDKKAAIDDLGSLKTMGGADAFAVFHLALIAEFTGDDKLAEETYQAYLKLSPSPRALDAYGRFLERAGRRDDAKALYSLYANEPGLKELTRASLARIATGRKSDALVTSAEDGAAEALFGIAASLTDKASADVSILYMRLALYLRPTLDLGAVLLADRFESLKKYDDAIAVYGMVPKNSPYWRLAQVEAALDEARADRADDAIKTLTSLTAAQPDDADAWIALGDTYRSKERFAEAAAAYDHALALRPHGSAADWPLYFAHAVAEQGLNNWSAAEVDLKKALALAPNEPTLLNYLGYTWVDQNRNIPEALAMLEKAHALKPTDGYIADSVGWAYYKLGRYEEAARTLQLAVQLVPGDPTINDHYGDALWRIGRKTDAQFQWYHALAFGPSDADKAVIEKKLKDGLGDAAH